MARKKTIPSKPLARELPKPVSQAQQIRDVVFSFDLNKKFVAADIMEVLPNISRDTVRRALLDMYDKGQIIRVKTGIYRRFK